MKNKHIVIIGGGAAGMMAAITASREGAAVTILEHKDRVGKKILMTGNGKCNLTNMSDLQGKYYGEDVAKIEDCIRKFDATATRSFFQELGLYTKEKRDGGVYPVSEQASSVLDVLRLSCEHLRVNMLTNADVVAIRPAKQGGEVEYLLSPECEKVVNKKGKREPVKPQLPPVKKSMKYDALIIATGGQAASVAGSDGSGYALAKSLGHSLIKPLPALVQLKCEGDYFKSIAGVRAQALLHLYIDGKFCFEEEGELQLTDYGISGIPVFQFSRIVARALQEKKRCEVMIDFMTFVSENDWQGLLATKEKFAYKTMEEMLSGLVNKKIAALACRQCNISLLDKLGDLSSKQWEKCLRLLKEFKVVVNGTNPFENAQVCSGGVPLSEVTETMESVKQKDVFFAGEILDCDGICGGYNLQWAWSSGRLAGLWAAKK